MSEIKPVSPLLDGMNVLERFSDCGRSACYEVEHSESGEKYVLKHIPVPESETKTQALILTGAVENEAGAQVYYEDVANGIRREVIKLQSLSGHSCVASWAGYQVEPREGVGFDIYLLMPHRNSLRSFLNSNALTQLQALNFGIDLCNALSVLRDAGFVFLNLKPENIFVDNHGHFMVGDLGLMPLEGLQFCAVPEHYQSDFSAPELMELFAEPNETSDLYSLGMILYYIFNGNHLPFDDGKVKPEKAKQQRLRGDVLPTPKYADYELAEIIAKACNADPQQRWATPAELRQALILYMQRNEVSDQLLVPPLPLEEPEEPAAEEAAQPEEPAAEEAVQAEESAVEEPAQAEEVEISAPEAVPEELDPEAAAELPKEEIPAEPEAEEAPAEEVPTEDMPTESNGEEDAEEAVAEENMSLDELLASVNDVLEEGEQETSADAPDFEANEAAQKEQQPKKRRRKFWIPLLIAILAVGAVGAALGYFYMNWYLVTMSDLTVVESTDSSVMVSYALSTPDPDLSWECIDTYGNSFPGIPGEDMVTFNELTPGMQYTISFHPGKLHKLLGTTSISAATAAQTQIVSFTAAPGGNSTTAEVSLVVSGPEPEGWFVNYTSTGSDSGGVNFSGHSVLIPGLNLHDTYTFELLATEGVYLAGETSCQLEMVADVQAKDLQVTAATEDTLSVTWENLADLPKSWSVSCVGEGYDETLEVTECAATFTGIDLNTAYTFTVTANGLDAPLSVALPANATVITSLEAEAVDAGRIEVTWACSEPQPEEGWVVRYLVGGDENLSESVTVTEENNENEEGEGYAVTLTGLPPKTEIVVQLHSASGDTIIGTQSLTVMMPEPAAFAEHDFASSESKLVTYAVPDMEDWGIDDLEGEEEAFVPGTAVAVVLQAPDGFNKRDRDETPITVVLRDESGKVVYYKAVSSTWNDMWNDGRYLTTVSLPETPGKYQIELYLNNQTVNSCVVTVNGEETPEDAQPTEE